MLFRALTDIVCVNSACPDDTSPANGWYLSDIHVRTYSGAETFSRAIAHRTTPASEPKMTKETAFHDRISARTRNVVEYKGYWLPDVYAQNGAIEEYWACREKAVVLDLSPLRKFEVTGPDAEALMQWCVTRDMKKLSQGQVVYTAMCYEHGGMIDDGTVFRVSRPEEQLTPGAGGSAKIDTGSPMSIDTPAPMNPMSELRLVAPTSLSRPLVEARSLPSMPSSFVMAPALNLPMTKRFPCGATSFSMHSTPSPVLSPPGTLTLTR